MFLHLFCEIKKSFCHFCRRIFFRFYCFYCLLYLGLWSLVTACIFSWSVLCSSLPFPVNMLRPLYKLCWVRRGHVISFALHLTPQAKPPQFDPPRRLALLLRSVPPRGRDAEQFPRHPTLGTRGVGVTSRNYCYWRIFRLQTDASNDNCLYGDSMLF